MSPRNAGGNGLGRIGRVVENPKGFWLMIEAGDVDWANHDNNIDNSISAVLSGDEAFRVVANWVESNERWDQTAVILTADHGHYFGGARSEGTDRSEIAASRRTDDCGWDSGARVFAV